MPCGIRFPDRLVGAPLKHTLGLKASALEAEFPRPFGRGTIEARSSDRCHRVRPRFPGRLVGTPLKRGSGDRHGDRGAASFPGRLVGAPLKRDHGTA